MTAINIVGRCWILTAALLLTLETGAHAGSIALSATLGGSQATPPNSSPGTGSAALILNDVSGTLITAGTFSGLTGTTTSADIEDSTGLVVHPFAVGPTGFPIGVTGGSFTDIWVGLTSANIAALESGSYYINIHTSAFPAGEIRGQIVSSAIPEPSSLVLLSLGLVGAAGLAWETARSKRVA